MKQFILSMCIVFSFNVHAQNHPLVVEGATWAYGSYGDLSPMPDDFFGISRFALSGDTTLIFQTYKKLYYSPGCLPQPGGCVYNSNPCYVDSVAAFVGGMREESGGKVYFLAKDSLAKVLIYDFALTKGDTFCFPPGTINPNPQTGTPCYAVEDVDSVMIQGVMRKRISFPEGEYWIEGIGSKTYLVNAFWNLIGNLYSNLVCHRQPGLLVLGDSTSCSCAGTGTPISDPQTGASFSLQPNPGTGSHTQLSLVLPHSKGLSLDIYSSTGKRLFHSEKKIAAGAHTWALPQDYPAGVYVVVLTVGAKRMTEKWLVR